MSEEILINVTPQETRIAFIENGSLQEIAIERQRSRGIVSNIYKGRVSRVLPGMEAAFIDIGLERAAFLHVSDLDLSPEEKQSGVETTPPQIQAILRAGQELLVQVIKEPLGTKGARLTSEITIPSRYLVYLPSGRNIGVSSRIEDEDERRRLKGVLQEAQAEHRVPGGFIVRTAAEGADNESLRRDMLFLHKLWSDIAQRAQPAAAGRLVHEDLPIVLRTLRDLVGGTIEKVRIDSREAYHRAAHFAERMEPELLPMLEHYTGERPIFELYNVEEEIQRALERKVPLKSGGYLIIDQTEAMTTVDVNTGGYVGHRTLEETIFKTNLEAAQSIARQLRLRNLGGIIIIDFIDMREAGHREQVMKALQKALERDHAKTKVCAVSSLGLIEMTRKRTRESLEHVLCQGCPTCGGRGGIKTAETVCYEVFREILRLARQYDARQMLVLAGQSVIDRLLDEDSTALAELQAFTGVPVRLQVEALYTPEQYDIVLI
ncbi:MAG: ribonuclease G [Halothiobacillaceae bacterium]|nr:MAG: ribonuclease G [Halothiobacillaceae bacterium]